MTIPHVLGFTFLGLVLLFAGILARGNSVWSSGSSATIAWFCHAFALALAIVGATSLLCQCAPGRIPSATAKRVTLVTAVVIVVGLLVDNWGEYGRSHFWIGVAEWIGLVVILGLFFDVSRRADERAVS